MANKMLIDTTHPEETRVVVVRGNRVEEFDFESANRQQLRGNIYLAKVTRVEPSLQAAFVEYGGNRHGFLAFSEIHPDYYQIPVADRQALLDEEERAHRDADDEADRRAGGSHSSSGGHRSAESRQHVRRGDPVETDENGGSGDNGQESTNEAHQPPDAAPAEELEGRADSEAAAEQQESTRNTAQPDVKNDAPERTSSPVQDEATQDSRSQDGSGDAAAAAPEDRNGGEAHVASPDTAPDSPDAATDNTEAELEEVGSDEEDIVESVGGADALEEVQERTPRYRRQYKIQEVIKRRQVMLVQVVKEERGTKGAALTTYLSLAGRYSVLMPNTARGGGISRKITSADDRRRLKQIASDLEVPEGMGVILRTAGANRTKAEVKRDFEYLLRLWETVRDLTLKSTAPKLVYEEGSLIKRAIRDLYNKDIDEVIVAGEDGYRDAKDFMRMLMPSHAKNVKLYKDTQPLLTRYGIESQLDAMFSPTVQLRSGGYIVINQAEALVAIDVNSGRATREHHIEDTAHKTNLEAAEEIARQLRLRDLAGLIVIDFIDMDEKRNNRSVERKLKECLKNDRARIQVGRISHFGLLEMSRQRIRSSVLESSTEKCPHCGGTGHVRSVSSVTLQLLRSVEETLLKGGTHNLIVRTRADIALYVLNQKRAHLRDLEARFQITITVSADATINGQQPYVVERGEQVHTPEAARAIAAQASSIAPLLVEEEDEADADSADAAGMSEGDDSSIAAAEIEEDGDADEASESVANGEDGGRRRRRRRRRRGGERPAGAEAGAPADRAAVQEAFAEGETTQEPAGEARAETADEAERRRKRRGRRGGRRNRRDSEGTEPRSAPPQNGETTVGWQEWAHGGQTDAVAPPATPQAEPQAAEMPAAAAPPLPVAASDPEPITNAPGPSSAESTRPPRRRSTVREPVPFVVGDVAERPTTPASADTTSHATSTHTPTQPSETSAEPQAEEAGRPRKTGWWSRRVFGGGG